MRTVLLGNVASEPGAPGAIAPKLDRLSEWVRFALQPLQAERVFYLGGDSALEQYQRQTAGSLVRDPELSVWQRSLGCLSASPDEIERTVEAEQQLGDLSRLVSIPRATTLRVPISRRHEAVLCFDRIDVTDQQMLACSVLAFGNGRAPLVRQLGSKFMLCPGAAPEAGLLLLDTHDGLKVSLFDHHCEPVAEHDLSDAGDSLASPHEPSVRGPLV